MAEIDGTNPLSPVWPQRPGRRIEEDDKSKNERQRDRQKQQQEDKKKDNDDGSPRIDEYV